MLSKKWILVLCRVMFVLFLMSVAAVVAVSVILGNTKNEADESSSSSTTRVDLVRQNPTRALRTMPPSEEDDGDGSSSAGAGSWQVTYGPRSSPVPQAVYWRVALGSDLFVASLFQTDEGGGAVETHVLGDDGVWTVLDNLLTEENFTNYASFGWAVDLAHNSDHGLIVSDNPGAAYYYQFNKTNKDWTRIGGVIRPQSPVLESGFGDFGFGFAVATASFILRVAIAAPMTDIMQGITVGCVYTFEYNGTHWEERVDHIICGDADYDMLGLSIDMTRDGNRLLVGAPGTGDGDGPNSNVQYHEWSGSSWTEIFSVIGSRFEFLGGSVAISSSDGNTIAVGGPGYGNYTGVVRVYSQATTGSSFTQLGSDIVGSTSGEMFGTTLTGSNGRVIVGSRQGGIHAYDFDATVNDWVKVGTGPTMTDSAAGVQSVSTTGNAQTILALLGHNDTGLKNEINIYELQNAT